MATSSWSLLLPLWFSFAVALTSARGTWEVLVANAGIASMHTAVTRFNTVILLDRTDSGGSQLKLPDGECPNNDCTAHSVILDLATNTIRPLMILTDTLCSSGQFLPDGTLLQSGGYNEGGNKLRKFTPCTANGDCDWVEIEDVFLYNNRWYATNQILPDGSVIIIGGNKNNGLEFFPQKPGGASVNLPFLAKQADNAWDILYPYVHLLPNGLLFIFANTASILYNYTSYAVVKEFPALPGGPRNYPSAGSSVMLALGVGGDYSQATILVCGGATYGAYRKKNNTSPTQGTCGYLVPTRPKPYWHILNMPFGRIMGDMVILPTGDVLIINGAQAGSQGYGLATNPALYPVLYQSAAKKGHQFTTLNPTTIPRMYHSTANLLPDGRVLVAGSNTHLKDNFTSQFPTELRIEAFSPGYLARGNAKLQPVLVEFPQTIGYGEAFDIVVSVAQPVVAGMVQEVNMASAPYATHSFSQGQRLIKLITVTNAIADGDGQYKIRCTAPPDGMVAPPGWYMTFVVNQGVPSAAGWIQISSIN